MSNLFANVLADGSIAAQSGVLSVTRGIPGVPKAYVLELARMVDPTRSHIAASCRATVTAPAERYNSGMLDPTHAVVIFFGEDGSACDMPFTATVEEF